jgi:hypothetical protein
MQASAAVIRVGGLVGSGQHDEELIAAVASGEVARSQLSA